MDMITKIISEKKLFWISFAIVGYFCLLYLNAYFAKSDLVFIGWVQELLTIPFILFQFILLIIAILYCIKETFRINRYSFWSFFILLINNLFVICSLSSDKYSSKAKCFLKTTAPFTAYREIYIQSPALDC